MSHIYFQFLYDNGVGSSADRFDIDLYQPTDDGTACGTKIVSLCDKESIGCMDSGQKLRAVCALLLLRPCLHIPLRL